jgi:hypothetical protein
MFVNVEQLRPLKKAGHYGFNLFLELDDLQLVVIGFRVLNGYVNPPTMMNGGKYYGTAYLAGTVTQRIYNLLADELPPGTLKPFDKAMGAIALTTERAAIYTPKSVME